MKYKNFTITEKLGVKCFNQSGLFTQNHVKYKLYIRINDEIKEFPYQFNPNATRFEKWDGLNAVILDALAYCQTRDFTDFMKEFGYENKESALKVYRACESTYNFFVRCGMSEEDLIELREKLDK